MTDKEISSTTKVDAIPVVNRSLLIELFNSLVDKGVFTKQDVKDLLERAISKITDSVNDNDLKKEMNQAMLEQLTSSIEMFKSNS